MASQNIFVVSTASSIIKKTCAHNKILHFHKHRLRKDDFCMTTMSSKKAECFSIGALPFKKQHKIMQQQTQQAQEGLLPKIIN